MQEVFCHQDFSLVGLYQSVLTSAGISCFIRNQATHNTMTGLPAPLFFPALCVTDPNDFDRAMELLKEVQEPTEPSADWKCASCGEDVPGNFDVCWKCNQPRDSAQGI